MAADLSDVPFGDITAWRDFLQRNAIEHRRFAAMILATSGHQVGVNVYADEGDMKNWLQANSDAHLAEMKILGIGGGIDLVDVDLTIPDAYNDWMARHAAAHQITRRALGM